MKNITLIISVTRIGLIGLLIMHTTANNPVTRSYLGFGAILCFITYFIATIVKQVTIRTKKETQNIFQQYGNILECLGFLILVLLLVIEA